jgi:hypothetical protein
LRKAPQVAAFFGKELMGADKGLNIEGIAVVGTRLIVGLRAPNNNGIAYLVSASIAELFAPGSTPAIGDVEVIELALGENLGVRDIALLPDGRLLILAGPMQAQPVRYAFYIAEPRRGGSLSKPKYLANLDDGGKAEAVMLLGVGADALTALVLFDGPKNGGPRQYRVPLN